MSMWYIGSDMTGTVSSFELMAVTGGLSQSFDFSYAGGCDPVRLQHDSAYPAQYTSDRTDAVLHMFLFEQGGRLLRDFRLRFGPGQVTDETVTCMPCEGVELDCCVTDWSDDEEGPATRCIEVEELRVHASVRARPGQLHADPGAQPAEEGLQGDLR